MITQLFLPQEALGIRSSVCSSVAPICAWRGPFARTLAKGLMLILAWSLGLGEDTRAWAQTDEAEALNQRVVQLYQQAKYREAIPIAIKVVAMQQETGPDEIKVTTALNNLAELFQAVGAFDQAEPLLRQVLQLREKASDPNRVEVATSLNNLAALYYFTGVYAKAEPLYQRALEIYRKAIGPDNASTVTVLNNLAELYQAMGAYANAEPLFQQAVQIRRKTLEPDHPEIAQSLNNLAALYVAMGAYAKAEPLFQQALQIYQEASGLDQSATATALNNLGALYQHMGAYAKAAPLYQQALQIKQKTLGLEHPDTATSLGNLALLKMDLGEFVAAKALAEQSAQAHLASLSKILSFTSEQDRLAYESTIYPYLVFGDLEGSDVELATLALRYKGVVLDSLIEDRLVAESGKGGKNRELIERMAVDKRQLGRLLLQRPDPNGSDQSGKRTGELEQEVEQIEGQLAKDVAGLGKARRALTVSVAQVQAVIPETGALIEYLRYWHYLGRGGFEPRYGALVLFPREGPKWIPLAGAVGIDSLVSAHQRLTRGASVGRDALSNNLQALYGELWAPIVQALPPEVKRAIISPDGQLNFVSFATLLDPERHFLAEKYSVQYVASGRDLLRQVSPAPRRTVSVFANPDFGATADGADHAASSVPESPPGRPETRELEGKSFPQLKGTQKECEELTKAFESWQWSVDALTGKDANKAALLRVDSPYILHLATHGFFERAEAKAKDSLEHPGTIAQGSAAPAKFFENPMHRSGLALAGANATLRGWQRGEPPALEDDGIVTAEDVAALHLNEAWLVTLSACDTGAGEVKAGEGVLGLRRGFLQAGAQNLLMSLWRVSDSETTKFMRDFYQRARQTPSAPEALAAVQREWLTAIRERQGLEQAVSLAGPFIMSSQGKP
jgi:CHAT domain-containing protein/tetratricopeptide (TPR) repeat protein